MRVEDSIPPALRTFDLERLIGLSLDEARSRVEGAGGSLRAVGSDENQGLPTVMTMEWRANRVTVVITDGRVVRALGIG